MTVKPMIWVNRKISNTHTVTQASSPVQHLRLEDVAQLEIFCSAQTEFFGHKKTAVLKPHLLPSFLTHPVDKNHTRTGKGPRVRPKTRKELAEKTGNEKCVILYKRY